MWSQGSLYVQANETRFFPNTIPLIDFFMKTTSNSTEGTMLQANLRTEYGEEDRRSEARMLYKQLEYNLGSANSISMESTWLPQRALFFAREQKCFILAANLALKIIYAHSEYMRVKEDTAYTISIVAEISIYHVGFDPINKE